MADLLTSIGDFLGLNKGKATQQAADANKSVLSGLDTTGTGYLDQALGNSQSLLDLGKSGSTMYANALGLNGADGTAAARSAYMLRRSRSSSGVGPDPDAIGNSSSAAILIELTLPDDSPLVGVRVGQIEWPVDTVLACIVRDTRPIPPSPDDTLEGRDELLFVTGRDASEQALQELLTDGPSAS